MQNWGSFDYKSTYETWLQSSFISINWHLAKIFQESVKLTDSPIEAMFLAAWVAQFRFISLGSPNSFDEQDQFRVGSAGQSWRDFDEADMPPRSRFVIIPQFKWCSYRIDFAIGFATEKAPAIFVECDGFDFHERTSDQAVRDRSRDREVQAAGIKMLRFTGRELWKDAFGCAEQVQRILFNLAQPLEG